MERITIQDIDRVIQGFEEKPAEEKLSFEEALMSVGPAPCDTCDRSQRCAEEAVECFGFRIWVNKGDLSKVKPEKIGKMLKPCK
jgi:hypothetical protein